MQQAAPVLCNLRAGPHERGTDSMNYRGWLAYRMFLLVPEPAIVGKYLETY